MASARDAAPSDLVATAADPAIPDPSGALARLWVARDAGCVARGAAVSLGEGMFLSAAHLVDPMLAPRGCAGPARAALRHGTATLRARIVRLGRAEVDPTLGLRYVGGRDLVLLAASPADPAPAGPAPSGPLVLVAGPSEVPARPCAAPYPGGAEVLVVTPRRRTTARLLPASRQAGEGWGSYDEIDLRLEPGESGGAVFAPASGCLLGIVSHREEGVSRTRLVPAATIRRFLEE